MLSPEFELYVRRCESGELLDALAALQRLLDGGSGSVTIKPRKIRRFAKRFLHKLNLPPLPPPPLTTETLRNIVLPALEQLLEDLWHDWQTGSPPFQRRRRRRHRGDEQSTAALGVFT